MCAMTATQAHSVCTYSLTKNAKLRKSRDIRLNASRRDLVFGGLGAYCCGNCTPKTGWYDKFFAGVMANGMDSYEEGVKPFKQELLRGVRQKGQQKILEVGIGAAPNLQYLVDPEGPAKDGLEVVGIDPNPFMFEYARQKGSSLGLSDQSLSLVVGMAEELPIESETIDTIICTLVLCSVGDVGKSVREMQRVLRPQGQVHFLEHVIASKERKLLRFGQQALSPVQQLLADGCHLTRNPLEAFRDAGFRNVEAQTFDVPGLGILGPHISGIATA